MASQTRGPTGPAPNPLQARPARTGNPGDTKRVGQGVFELRLTYGPGYRIYYTQRGTRVVLLLCGGDKSTQGSDITKAHQLAAAWHPKEEGHDR